jgi:hypothetical protein
MAVDTIVQPKPVAHPTHARQLVGLAAPWLVEQNLAKIQFISIGIGSQVGRKVMIWNSEQRRKRKGQRNVG